MANIKQAVKHFLYEMFWTTATGGLMLVTAAVAVTVIYNLWMFYWGTIVLGGIPQ